MNVLLFAPGLLVLLLKSHGIWKTIPKLTICAVTQVLFIHTVHFDYGVVVSFAKRQIH